MMARTPNGNPIGVAAQIEAADLAEELLHSQLKERRRKRREALKEKDRASYQELIRLDPLGGKAWFDDDGNIPARGSIMERIKLVQARIDELKYIRTMPQFVQDAIQANEPIDPKEGA